MSKEIKNNQYFKLELKKKRQYSFQTHKNMLCYHTSSLYKTSWYVQKVYFTDAQHLYTTLLNKNMNCIILHMTPYYNAF